MTFTVTKKGQEINFDSAFSDVNIATYYVKEHLSFNSFAMDLVARKKLSEKQVAWIHYLATDHLTKELEQEQIEPKFLPIVEKMYNAVKGKVRKFQVRLPGFTLSTGSYNNVYIYENGRYAGKITEKGHLEGNVSEDVKNLLEDANENLLQLAKIYGHESGCCSICGRTLNDPLSVQMGIGPVCAKRLS
jgi:hypothetical protein